MQLTDLSFLFDDNPQPMWIYDLSSLRILKVNKAATDKYGYSETEFLLLKANELHPQADQEKLYKTLRKKGIDLAVLQGINYGGIWTHEDKNGNHIFVELTSYNTRFENLACRVVSATDASEKMRFQEELIWTKSNLEALINNTEDQIWSVDKEMRYVYMNRAYRQLISQLTGTEPKDGDYTNLHPGFNEGDVERWSQYYHRALEGERYTVITESVDPITQNQHSFEVSFNPIYKIKGDITGVGCFARDITAWLATEKAMVDQNERLRNIASVTSHELRRPVASMLGLINIMDRENFFNPDNREIIEHLLVVGKEIDEVIRLIVDQSFMEGPSKDKFRTP
ncbi:PAS domain S-box protein [uncultured Mucilaginibacter sp.]|uniref:PAS domain S-box protein n=1 Tax=uncultured Mucilaginibacter sp. TaxID=797541 RepID=UPI0025DFC1C5|nr:PAS domain S-box protein [uncultured Mucilaginibacter sp.]